MNKILSLAAALAVGSASVAVHAQSDTGAPGGAYGQFRPTAGEQQAAAEQPAAPAAQAPAPQAPMQPEQSRQPATAAQQVPAQVHSPMMGMPRGYGPGPGFGHGYMDPYGGHSWARYEERKRFLRDRHMYQRYAGPRRGYGRYSRFGPSYGGPPPYQGAPQAPAPDAEQAAPAAEAAQPGGY